MEEQKPDLMSRLNTVQWATERALGQQEVLIAAMRALLQTVEPTSATSAHIQAGIREWIALVQNPDSQTPAAAVQAAREVGLHLVQALQPRQADTAH